MRFLLVLLAALSVLCAPALAQVSQTANVVATCGTPNGAAYAAGQNRPTTQNTSGQLCDSLTVTTASAAQSATVKGGTITSGGTSQTIIASNSSRKGFVVQNPCTAAEQGLGATEDLVINLTNAATLTTSANLVSLAPCASFSMGVTFGLVSTEAVTAIATTTAHVFYAKEF